MAVYTLPTYSLKINNQDVTSTFDFVVSDITGAEAIPPANVQRQALPGYATPIVGLPVPLSRVITITGTVSGTTVAAREQNLAALQTAIGFTTYGARICNLLIASVGGAMEFEGYYAGDWQTRSVGPRVNAKFVEISFSIVVTRAEAETGISSLKTGSLSSTVATGIYIGPSASKGAGWTPSQRMDEAIVVIKNANATPLTTISVKGLHQGQMVAVAGTPGGSVQCRIADGFYPHTFAIKNQSGDTQTLKYATTEGTFIPNSQNFAIHLMVKFKFTVASEASERTLFSCNNGTDGSRTKIYLSTDKKVKFQVGAYTLATIAYTSDLVADTWYSIDAIYRSGSYAEIAVTAVAGITAVAASTISPTADAAQDANGYFFIGSKPDGTAPSLCEIGECCIWHGPDFFASSVAGTNLAANTIPLIENNKLQATHTMSFGVDFRAAFGINGVGRKTRTITGVGISIAQNQECHLYLHRGRAYLFDIDNGAALANAELTSYFAGEWPVLAKFAVVYIAIIPVQASVTYRILGRNAAII